MKGPRGIFYGWWLVAITVLVLAMVIGPIFQGLGTFFVALERQFGWSRTALSGAFSLGRVEGALLGPVEGLLSDRMGTRRVVLLGLLVLGAGLIWFSFLQGIVSFYLAFIVVFMGAGLGSYMPLMTAINHWFVRRRATAMAVGLTGINLGGLLVPGLAWLIVNSGWRATSRWLGISIALLALPISRALRNRPEEYGQRPDGDPIQAQSAPRAPGPGADGAPAAGEEFYSFPVREALRTPAFWAITGAHSFAAIAAITVSVHIIPALTDLGMSLPAAGTVVSVYTIAGIVFQLVGGYLGDRLPKPPTIAAFIAIQAVAMVIAATVHSIPGAYLFAVLYGIGFGGRVPLLTAIRGEYFGRRNFATLLGVSQVPMNLSTVIGPLAAGYLYDTRGSYTAPFLGLAVVNIIGAGMILLAKKPALRSGKTAQRPIDKRGER